MKFNLRLYFKTVSRKILEEFNHVKLFFVRSKDRIVKKRKEFLTVMIIPHNEKPSFKLSITYKLITLFFLAISLVIATSATIVLGYSGRAHEMEELEISSNDY